MPGSNGSKKVEIPHKPVIGGMVTEPLFDSEGSEAILDLENPPILRSQLKDRPKIRQDWINMEWSLCDIPTEYYCVATFALLVALWIIGRM